MESNCNGDSFVSSSSRDVETVDDLLEECWFFENLLKRRTRMLRCYSDPCPSSKRSQDVLAKNSESQNTSSMEKMKGDGVVIHGLIRAPSLPPCLGRKEDSQEQEKSNIETRQLTRQSSHQNMLQAPKPICIKKKEESYKEKESAGKSKLTGQSSCRILKRAPSLPPNIGREDICQDFDSAARMSRLIQLAFANSWESLPLQNTPKSMPQSCSIQRHRPPRSTEVESSNTTGIKEISRRYLTQQKLIKKSLNDLETEEVQGFKDLGFTFEKKDLSPSIVNILPGLQEQKREELNQDIEMRRPYLSEAWLVQNYPPPIPNWVAKNSAEDMKAHLKFWARSVASNVR